ncbi:MAG TPA: hypothetical protein VF497_18085 [Rudaea sp.]
MKSLFLSLFISLALLLVGCGRSKPPSSKTSAVETATQEDATPPPPPDALPPKAVSAPLPPPTIARPASSIPFAPLPPGKDPAGDAERQKFLETSAKQADAVKRELEQRAAQLQNQPESNNGQ